MQSIIRAAAAAVFFLGLSIHPPSAPAGVIVAPLSVTASEATRPGFRLVAVIDQTGLDANYVSGVTDFDLYIASGPIHNSSVANNDWATDNGVTTAQITFDFGGAMELTTMALWNRAAANAGVRDFVLTAGLDAGFADAVVLGSYTATATLGVGGVALPETFAFAPTVARYLRLDVTSAYGGCCITLGEVAFERLAETETIVDAIDEPPTVLMMGGMILLLAGLGTASRRSGGAPR